MSEKTPSIGIAAYVAIGTTTTFTELCTLGVGGGGAEAAIVELEPCLNETEVTQTVDIPKDKPITIQYKRLTGASATISDNLKAALKAKTTIKLAIKYPTSTAVYARQDGLLSDHDTDTSSRPNHLTNTMVFLPQSAVTYSTTAPATS
jgi:hypothetical protein